MFHHAPVLVLALAIGTGIGQHYWVLGAIFCIVLTLIRACLDQHLIAIRSTGIRGDHLRSGTSLIAITPLRRLRCQLSAVQTTTDRPGIWKLLLTAQCTVMHATWPGGWELSQHQQPLVCCGGDPGLPECTVQQWVVVGKTNSRVSFI